MLYEYMVTYKFENGNGRLCVTRASEISSYLDLQSVDELIKEHTGLDVYVENYKLLRVYQDDSIHKDDANNIMELIKRDKVNTPDAYNYNSSVLHFCSICKEEVSLSDFFCFNCGQRQKENDNE